MKEYFFGMNELANLSSAHLPFYFYSHKNSFYKSPEIIIFLGVTTEVYRFTAFNCFKFF